MTHVIEGDLMAYLDNELERADVLGLENHLGKCGICAVALERIRAERQQFQGALAMLGADEVLSARVGARVQSRIRTSGSLDPSPVRRTYGFKPTRRRLLEAAVLVLTVVGGASALVPGLPLNRWLSRRLTQEAVPPASAVPLEPETQSARDSGVRVNPTDGRIRVTLHPAAGARIHVTLVDGEGAAVFAGPGGTFRSADGVLEATIADGLIRVELPRNATEVTLQIEDRVYLRVRSGLMDVVAPAVERTETEVVFQVP